MARAAVKAKQQAQAPQARPAKTARRRRRGGGNPNEQLFFMRLRRGQKWLYAVLALVFAATFAGVGVGSGNGGLSDLYTGLFGGGGNAVAKAKQEIARHPAQGYRALATAYEAKGDTAGAIGALRDYLRLRRTDAGAWAELGGLALTQAQSYATRYQQAQQAAQLADPSQPFQPAGILGQAVGTNSVYQGAAQQAAGQAAQLYQQATTSLRAAVGAYQRAAKLQPRSAPAQQQLATAAESAGDLRLAIAAWRRYLQLEPASPQRHQIEQRIKQLASALPKPAPAKK